MTRGVLFDFDGVLIDSPPIHAWAWAEIFRPYGIELPPERLHKVEGKTSEAIAAEILEEFGLTIAPTELTELLNRKRALYRENAPKGLRSDALIALKTLKTDGWLIGLVTGSARENIISVLKTEELALFDTLVTAESYERGKPDPEPYTTGCKHLKLPVNACFAVENAPLGIMSAKSAGLFVVAVTTTLPAAALREADEVLPDLTGLPKLLKYIAGK